MTTNSNLVNLFEISPFSLSQSEKEKMLLPKMKELTLFHYNNCNEYKNVINRVYGGIDSIQFNSLEQIPFFPVSLFKTYDLLSVSREKIIKTLTSSGTTSESVSKVFLDKETAENQAKALIKIVQHFIGSNRLPMVILDHKSVISDRTSYSARGAGIMGMIQFGYKPFYALNDDMSLDFEGLEKYVNSLEPNTNILLFGFTFMVWQYFILELEKQNKKLNLENGILIHSGGWKKLKDISVDLKEFNQRTNNVCKISKCLNFYGMVEQIGSVYFENDLHYLHTPVFSDVLIRDPETLKSVPDGTQGLIQLVSTLPGSYPGHSILTEDIGVIKGVDNPKLKMKGKYFEVIGRVPKAQLRGCSDTFKVSEEN